MSRTMRKSVSIKKSGKGKKLESDKEWNDNGGEWKNENDYKEDKKLVLVPMEKEDVKKVVKVCKHTLLSGKNKGEKCGKKCHLGYSYCKAHYEAYFEELENEGLVYIYSNVCTDLKGHILTYLPYEYKLAFVQILMKVEDRALLDADKFVEKRIHHYLPHNKLVTDYYYNTLRKRQYWIVNGKKEGVFRKWYKFYCWRGWNRSVDQIEKWAKKKVGKEKLERECFYIQGKKNGYYKKFQQNGKLMVDASYKNNKRDGKWEQFYNGCLLRTCEYKCGKRHGLQINYNLSFPSIISMKKLFDMGKLIEEWNYKYETGQLVSNLKFGPDHKLDGLCSIWYENGQLHYTAMYKKGVFNGKAKAWNRDGIPIDTEESGMEFESRYPYCIVNKRKLLLDKMMGGTIIITQ